MKLFCSALGLENVKKHQLFFDNCWTLSSKYQVAYYFAKLKLISFKEISVGKTWLRFSIARSVNCWHLWMTRIEKRMVAYDERSKVRFSKEVSVSANYWILTCLRGDVKIKSHTYSHFKGSEGSWFPNLTRWGRNPGSYKISISYFCKLLGNLFTFFQKKKVFWKNFIEWKISSKKIYFLKSLKKKRRF